MKKLHGVKMKDLWSYADKPLKHIVIAGVRIPYRVDRRNVRNTRLEFRKGELLVVLSPSESSEAEILKEKQKWVLKNYLKICERRNQIRTWHDESQIMIMGKPFTFVEYVEGHGVWIDFERKAIHMNRKIQRHKSQVKNILKRKLAEEIHKRINMFSEELGRNPNGFRIKTQKTSWGSCSSKQNLNFNLKLIFLPPELVDYVVFHEILHLRYMSHGKRFRAVMKKRFRNVKQLEDKLATWWHYVQMAPVAELLTKSI